MHVYVYNRKLLTETESRTQGLSFNVGSYMSLPEERHMPWCSEGSRLRGVHHVREAARQVV